MSIYNNIPAMACKCQDTAELDEILRQLKEWGVPDHCAQSLFLGDILISWEENGLITYRFQESIFNVKEVSPSDFLSAFREVYEGNQKQAAIRNATVVNNYGENYGNTSKDNTIVFPSDDEVTDEILVQNFSISDVQKVAKLFNWYKQRIIKLNPHLKV